MKQYFLTTIFVSIILTSGFNALAMNDDQITLKSQDGQSFKIEVRVAKLSQTLKDLIEDAGIDAPIPLPNITGKQCAVLVALMKELDILLRDRTQDPFIYIPSAFQPIVNETLYAKVSNQFVGEIFLAANYLDIPFLLNAVGAIIANRINDHTKFLKPETSGFFAAVSAYFAEGIPWEKLTPNQRRLFVAQILQKQHFGKVPKGPDLIILKHLRMRKNGILQEYSIADYIAHHGQPPLVDKEITTYPARIVAANSIDLERKSLTSLYGISLLQSAPDAESLWLGHHNYFFDILNDLQKDEYPFDQFSKLIRLDLEYCELADIPDTWFNELSNLQILNLQDNVLAKLNDTSLAKLIHLRELNLSHNNLHDIPDGLFTKLSDLQELYLGNNQITDLSEHAFSTLANLRKLYLNNNQLTCLPNELLTGTVQLRMLNLESNKLTCLQNELLAPLTHLEWLSAAQNQLTYVQHGLLNGLIHLRWLFLYDNQLTHLEDGALTGLVWLRHLDLQHNKLTHLQNGLFAGLVSLDNLILNDNHVDELQDTLFMGLVNLQALHLENMQLTELPEGLLNGLVNLRWLFLDNNNLTYLSPQMLNGLVILRELRLKGNQLSIEEQDKIRAALPNAETKVTF